MNVRFVAADEYGITKYLNVLRNYGEVTTSLKRGKVDPDVVVAVNGEVLAKLFEIMNETGRTIEISENNGADAEEVPIVAELMPKKL